MVAMKLKFTYSVKFKFIHIYSKSHSSHALNQRTVNLNGIVPTPGPIDNSNLVESPNKRVSKGIAIKMNIVRMIHPHFFVTLMLRLIYFNRSLL